MVRANPPLATTVEMLADHACTLTFFVVRSIQTPLDKLRKPIAQQKLMLSMLLEKNPTVKASEKTFHAAKSNQLPLKTTLLLPQM